MFAAETTEIIGIERIPRELLRHPLEFISADHARQRVVCDLLDRLTADPFGEAAANFCRAFTSLNFAIALSRRRNG